MGKSKKGQRGRKDDDTEDDVAAEIDLLKEVVEENKEPVESLKQRQKQKKKDKKKQKEEKFDEDDDDEEMDDIAAFAKKAAAPASKTKDMLSAFQMLAMDDMSAEEDSAEEKTDKDEGGKKTTKKQDSVEDEDFEFEPSELKQKQKKNKKEKKQDKKKMAKQEEDDLDALLAQFEKPTEPKQGKKDKKKKGQDTSVDTEVAMEEKPAEIVPKKEEKSFDFKDLSSMTQEEIAKALGDDDEDEEDDRRKKRKEKKKANKEKEEAEEAEQAEEGSAEGLITIKTAAQKKKEKKERQKLQKLQEKNKQKTKTDQEGESQADQTAVASTQDQKEDEAETIKDTETAAAEPKTVADEEPTEEDDGKKKKKDRKKKKKGEKDEEETSTKKKPSKMVKAMQERLKLIKEEEERMRKEEEEKQRQIEEAIRLKEEQERLAKEKKERLKQKQKEKIERAKAEGRYLTPKQKEQQRRAQQMLEAMKAQGIAIPQKTEGETRKRVVYRKAPKKKPQTQEEAPTSPVIEESKTEEAGDDKLSEVPKEEVAPAEPEVKDSWDAESEDDVKDAWDEDSEEEEEVTPATPKEETVKKPAESKKEEEESDEDEDSEEDSEEESDEEDSEESSEEESEEEDDMTYAEKVRERAKARIQARHDQALQNKDPNVVRAPVVCVLGHVDTGKTKILDKLRKTNVQDGEAGGITQQIGATNVPAETIRLQTQICKEFAKQELKLPGLLIIDTPGHESFSNLRSRGSSLCDIAVLVVDIMHGLEPQTIESLNLLKQRKTPFIVALNKIDRLYQWQSNPHNDVTNTLKKQKPNTKVEFDERVKGVIVQFAEQALNAALFYENKNPREYISMVPTSAHSGDGMANLVALICDLSQKFLTSSIAFSEELQATVMEVKAIPGLGTTIDVILVNGRIREGDTIVVAGTEGPIVTQVRGVLTPQPLKELRVKGSFQHHKEIVAAQGVKLIGKDLEKALAGLPLFVAEHPDEVELYKEDVASALKAVLASIQIQDRGVFVQASTLGSLEALLEFLRTSKIPYAGINIGPVHKREVMKASVMLEHDTQLAVILAFDVKVEREAQELADSLGVQIFTADIIYHLFDSFMAYRDNIKKQKQAEFKNIAVFPCKLRVLPQYIFNSRDPIVMGVVIEGGFLKVGMPICVPSKEFLDLGRVTSLEVNHKSVEKVTKGQEVCIKIEAIPGEAPKMFGRHFDHTDLLMSKICRDSIDAVKNWFREEMTKADWQLMIELKKLFEIL